MLSRAIFSSYVPFSVFVMFFVIQAQAADRVVSDDDVNVILSALHPQWPPASTPTPSDIEGLTDDDCSGTADCVAPRMCFNCAEPKCYCVKPPPHANITCSSSSDCDPGEFCFWDLQVGLTSGTCLSSRYFGSLNETFPILHKPINYAPPAHSFGLTGDRCFFHEDCMGTRSCMARKSFVFELRNVSTCEVSASSCVCTPPSYTECESASDCDHPNEICASVLFQLSDTITFEDIESDQKASLTPVCISSNLTRYDNVLPLSHTNFSSFISGTSAAEIRLLPRAPSMILPAPQRIDPELVPFSVSGLSVFNTFTTNELLNEFIGGILSLIIVAQLHKILQGLVYSKMGIHHHGYSRYIMYSRLSSFRHVSRILGGREPFQKGKASSPRQSLSTLNYKLAIVPFLAFLFLIGAEVTTIMAGTDARVESFADQNFDPVISAASGSRRPRVQDPSNKYCDDFFVPTRGVFESGKVLKCVKPSTIRPEKELASLLRIQVLYGSCTTILEVYSQNGSFAAVELSTSVHSKSGENFKTMPFRPDLMSDEERVRLLNGILNNIATKLGYEEVDTSRNLWSAMALKGSGGKLDSMSLLHHVTWSEPLETTVQAVISGLRDLDLVLNSSGEPWVYTMPYTFERRKPLMAITKPYRMCHGWMVLAACLVTAFHIAVNSWVTHFDDVAYVAMKELLGEDCILGPLAHSNVVSKDVELEE